eukprot:CAMPEP_0172544338 /NCGR_PEP_ID=MMETSP1067-20121228/14518_1 /TAXON_ID=265564 ORGANISM="Thalassiosira punctigera, Strain Tpunct2005C2" /NCGR_SAMPLE_ID=MMETSP1067 /ASSEMBLY_ACC=CAM_ASM_000444 /LENGTH=500 /DNA_ID=CAMNT_0013330881 /DNA_START=183 /DNA_END=1685 /DNA_ORIENTATION=+
MATKAAIGLLTLLRPMQNTTTTDAFVLPQSAVRLPRRTFAQMLKIHDDDDYGTEAHPVDSSPIRSNHSGPLARLTHRQEVSLLRLMRAHPSHTSVYQMARQTLLLHNLPLVQSIVTKILSSRPHLAAGRSGWARRSNNGSNTGNDYHGTTQRRPSKISGSSGASESRAGAALTRDDLLHEGTIGLAEAIDRYDLAYAYESGDEEGSRPREDSVSSRSPRSATAGDGANLPKGARLGTYATYWIRARILRAIQSREYAVRFPEHALQASHRLARAAKDMGLDFRQVCELADYDVITVTQKQLRETLREKAGIKSESLFRDAVRVRTMSRSGSAQLESWMSPSSSFHDLTYSEAGQEHILETLSKFLGPREVEVLSLRYGLVSAEDDDDRQEAIVFRDYLAEAEEDLFGPDGVLSHYPATPNRNGVAAVANTFDPITTHDQARGKTETRVRAAPVLLPFREIGKRMKFSGEYCRRTCAVALNKLTQAAEEGRLAESDFLLGW